MQRPKAFGEIDDITPKSVANPRPQRHVDDRSHRVRVALGEDGDVGARRAQDKQRELFKKERPKLLEEEFAVFRVAWHRQPVERPVIKHQQRKRQGNDHRLRSQA